MDRLDPTIILGRKLPTLDERALREFIIRASRASGLRGSISVLVTGNAEIRRLNARFRAKNTPTDVLSFPALGFTGFAGDIAISAEMARQNARSFGHSFAEEVRILALHGILHLAGYDHERNHREMAAKERRLRKRLKLPIGLIERSSSRRAGSGRPRRRQAARSLP